MSLTRTAFFTFAMASICGCCTNITVPVSGIDKAFPWIGNGYPEGDYTVPLQMIPHFVAHAAPQRDVLVNQVQDVVSKGAECLVVEALLYGGTGGEVGYEGIGVIQRKGGDGQASTGTFVVSVEEPWWRLLQAQVDGLGRNRVLPEPTPVDYNCIVVMSYHNGREWRHSVALNPWGVMSEIRMKQDALHEATAMRFTNTLLIIAQDERLRRRMRLTVKMLELFQNHHVGRSRVHTE